MGRKKEAPPVEEVETLQLEPVQVETPTESAPVEQPAEQSDPLHEIIAEQTRTMNQLEAKHQVEISDLVSKYEAEIVELKDLHQAGIDAFQAERQRFATEINARIHPEAVPLAMLGQMIFEDEASRYVLDPYRTGGTYILRPIGRK